MSRIDPIEYDETTGNLRAVYDQGLVRFERMTNMKRTMLHSLPAYHALLEWYPLFDAIESFLGERLAIIFSHAISMEGDCMLCTTFMRRTLIEWGEDPNRLNLDEKGEVLVEFGHAISRPGNRVSDELYRKIAGYFNVEQIVALTGFACLMIATNVFNNVLEVELDEYLYAYRDGQSLQKKA